MLQSRLNLHEKLCNILGSRNVYFQPPENIKIIFPCIIYSKSNKDIKHADDTRYLSKDKYMVTIIDRNPDSEIPDKLEELKYCSSNRSYVADNLNHFVYDLYY